MLTSIAYGFKSFMDVFGSSILVPIVVFILSLILKVKAKDAFRAAIFMAIGLTAFGLILNILYEQMGNVMTLMSANVGKTFDVIDVGWPAGATIVYNNTLGMIYLIIGLVFNVVLFLTKITDTFEPTDIWNYYFFTAFGCCVQFVTGSLALGLICSLFINLLNLFTADVLAPALAEHYGYEGLTSTCFSCIDASWLGAILKIIFDKIGFGRVRVDADAVKKKLGFLGENAMIGVILGLIMGIIAYIDKLGQLSTWGTILTFAFTISAMLILYPTVSGLFVRGLIPISNTLNARMRSGEINREYFIIGIDPAVYYGETSNITSGIILIPILILTAVILPGNRLVPLADIPAITFLCIGFTAVFQGDILKTVIGGTIWGSLAHLTATEMAPLFTQAAANAGFDLSGAAYVHSWLIASELPGWLSYRILIMEGGIKWLLFGLYVALYVFVLISFKKNRKKWYMAFGASEEYVDNFMKAASERAAKK